MKKLYYLLLVCFLLGSCSKQTNLQSSLMKDFNLYIQPKTIEELYDDHGGFHGDGESLIKIHLETIPVFKNWNDCPLPSDLTTKIYNKSMIDASLLQEISQITKGKYQYIEYNSSFNYSLAIFDEVHQSMIYYRFDS